MSFLLKEDSGFLLKEDGSRIILDGDIFTSTSTTSTSTSTSTTTTSTSTTSTSTSTSTTTTSTSTTTTSTTTTLLPPQEIPSCKSTADDTTTATSIEDIDGLSCDITLPNGGYIMALMSLSASASATNKDCYFAIQIDGVDSPTITRKLQSANDVSSIGVVFRSVYLPAGTYTVKGRHWTEAGNTLTTDNATLVAFGTKDAGGNNIPSIYDTVASDNTTATDDEDIDGLIQSLDIDTSQVFAAIASSNFIDGNNKLYHLVLNIDGELTESERTLGVANDKGSVAIVGRTINQKNEASLVIKGQHHTESGTTATVEPSILIGLMLGVEGGTYQIHSTRALTADKSTNSTTIEDIDGTSKDIELYNDAHIIAVMSLSVTSSTSAKKGYFAISINGVDYPIITRFFSSTSDEANIFIVARTTSKLAAGSYTIKGRWYTENPATLSSIDDISLVAFALETIVTETTTSTSTTSTSTTTTSTSTSTTTTSTSTTTTSTSTTTTSTSTTTTSTSTSTSTTTTSTSTTTTSTSTTTTSTSTTTTSTSTSTSTSTTSTSTTTTSTTSTSTTTTSTSTTTTSTSTTTTTTTTLIGIVKTSKNVDNFRSSRVSKPRLARKQY